MNNSMLCCVALQLFLFLYISIDTTQALTNCSALYGFIQVRGSGIDQKTLVSKHGLFPPHSYESIPWTPLQLVTLSDGDNICGSSTAFSTNVTNKIVLIFEEFGNCSAQQKVFTAQQNGAKAVLMSNTDVSGMDVSLSSNGASILNKNISIPMRSISALEAGLLSDEIVAARSVEVQFGCNNASITSTLCLIESSPSPSDYGWVSGTYQRQEGSRVNGHPFWSSSGIAKFRNPHEIYLHIGDGGAAAWYWAVADVYSFNKTYDTNIVLRCAVTGASILHPYDCPLWETTKDEGTTWSTIPVNISSGLCPTTGSESVCIGSTAYALHAIGGTYSQKIPGQSMWFRELTECDWRSGVLSFVEDGYFGTNYFELSEPLNQWQIAICFVTESISVNKWKPNLCNEWLVLNDFELHYLPDSRAIDDTFTVSIGSCAATADVCSADNIAPDVMCFANNSIQHGSAMGQYTKLNEVGPYFASPVYQRIVYEHALYVASEDNPIDFYIWYTNEVWAIKDGIDPEHKNTEFIHYKRWVLTPTSLTDAINTGTYDERWGYCEGYAYGNPFACKGWVFAGGNALHYDERMSVTDSECVADPFPSVPTQWSEYICIGFHDTSDENAGEESSLTRDELRGAYKLNTSLVRNEWQIPHWMKDINDFSSQAWWIWWDEGWTVYNEERWRAYCDPYRVSGGTVDPITCNTWYDNDYIRLDNIYLYECSADDVLTLTRNGICLLSRNGTAIGSYLEGAYIDNGINTDEYGTVEFISLNALSDPIYLWYHDTKWWISTIDYIYNKSQHNETQVNVYGYCRGGIQGDFPFCEECWYFFWDLVSLDSYETAPGFEDCSFTLYHVPDVSDTDYCDAYVDIIYTGDITQPDSLCIEKVDDADNNNGNFAYNSLDDLPSNIQIMNFGEYEFDSSNDDYVLNNDEFYLIHDKITNYWLVTNDLNTLFLCTSDAETGWLPRDCFVYDEITQQANTVNNLFSIGTQCADDSDNKKRGKSGGKAAGVVVGILLAIIFVVAVVYLWFKCKQKPHQRVDNAQETEIVASGAAALPDEDDDDDGGGNKKQQYDMTALNPDDVDDDPLTA